MTKFSGTTPAETAEKLNDVGGWADKRSAEVAYELYVARETETLLKDMSWWEDVLIGDDACKKVAFLFSEIFKDLGNKPEVERKLLDFYLWAYKTATHEVEDRSDQ